MTLLMQIHAVFFLKVYGNCWHQEETGVRSVGNKMGIGIKLRTQTGLMPRELHDAAVI